MSMEYALEVAKKAKDSFFFVKSKKTKEKNLVLEYLKEELEKNVDYLLQENAKDVKLAEEMGTKKALLDRLILNEKRIKGLIETVEAVKSLDDPVGKVSYSSVRPNGLKVYRVRVPIGVIFMIYEARPNVTLDSAVLLIKSGNVGILRGGKEAINSNKALVNLIGRALERANFPRETIQLVEKLEHEIVLEFLKLDEYIDLVIPRGSERLIRTVVENSRIPVLRQEKGVCHAFVDASADKQKAEKIVINAKVQRPSVCNAIETLLIHKDYPYKRELLEALAREGVEIRGDEEVRKIFPQAKPATEEDWYTEYLDYIISVKIVNDIDEAIRHIEKYGSHHSEVIITENYSNAQKFLEEVDSAAVYVNASTRFTDGGEFGLGAEIGISTHKFHARGPMGLMELTIDKWIIYGDGQIRE